MRINPRRFRRRFDDGPTTLQRSKPGDQHDHYEHDHHEGFSTMTTRIVRSVWAQGPARIMRLQFVVRHQCSAELRFEKESVGGARLMTPTTKSSLIGKISAGGTRIGFEENEEPGRVRWFGFKSVLNEIAFEENEEDAVK